MRFTPEEANKLQIQDRARKKDERREQRQQAAREERLELRKEQGGLARSRVRLRKRMPAVLFVRYKPLALGNGPTSR